MPMDRGTPDLVRHCVAAVAKQYGGDVDRAFAICVAQLQKSGYLKPGTMQLTAAGRKKEAEHEAEPDAGKKMKAYEKLLKGAREARKDESYDDFDRLMNPRTRTGLEDTPHTVARKYETVSKQESSMDAMRRLAGISTRYTDRAVSEAKGVKWVRSDWFDDEFLSTDEMEQAKSPSGKFTAIAVKTPYSSKSQWSIYTTELTRKGGWNPVHTAYDDVESGIVPGIAWKRGYTSYAAAKKDAEAALLRLDREAERDDRESEGRLGESRPTGKEERALISKLTRLIIKGNEAAEDKFHKELVQKYGKSVADDIADAAQQAAADDDFGAASDDMDWAQGTGRYAEGRDDPTADIGEKLKSSVTNLQNEIADAKERLADLQDAWQKRDWKWLAQNDYITMRELKAIEQAD